MEYQKLINLLHNTSNQLSKFKTNNRIKINGESRGTYNIISQIKFKSAILVYAITVMHTYLLKAP